MEWSVENCAIILVGMCVMMDDIEASVIFALKVSANDTNLCHKEYKWHLNIIIT